jgi:hypothetical protein
MQKPEKKSRLQMISLTEIRLGGKTAAIKNDDIFLRENGKEIQLTQTKGEEVNPVFSPNSNYIALREIIICTPLYSLKEYLIRHC